MTDSGGGFSMERVTGSKSNMIVVIASALVVIGAFLTWATVSGFGQSESATGLDEDGTITLIIGIATIGAALFLKGRNRMIAVLIGGALVTLIAVIDVVDVMTAADDFEGLEASVGIGLWLTLLGGIGILAGAFVKD